MKSIRTYLALGDSYTVGEAVAPAENFPNQLCSMLCSNGHLAEAPRIIAKTGWTTDELMDAINQAEAAEPIPTHYDLVTLLIGVNNQYRGRSIEEFTVQFSQLLKLAIRYAKNDPEGVRVLSIPDWGVTPYAEGRDRSQIATEIDAYNHIKLDICQSMGVPYIYITDLTREAAVQTTLLTSDGLHPSGIDYFRWAERVLGTLTSS